jgi:hypothetical protein
MIGPRFADAAETAPAINWPGELDGPKSIYVSSSYGYLLGRFGETLSLVSRADEERAPTSVTDPPINDNKVGGNTLQAGQTTVTITTSIHAGHVSADMVVVADVAYTNAADGKAFGSQKSTATAHFDVSPCPEVSGVAGGTISVHLRQDTTFPDGSRSSSTSIAEGPFRIINGDDAHRVRTEVDLQVTGDSLHTAPPKAGTDPVGWGVTGPLNLTRGASGSFNPGTVNESQWKGTGAFSKDDAADSPAEDFIQGILLQLDREVEKFWRSGKCIRLKPSEKSRDADPGEKIELTVESEQRFDQQEVKAPIKAELTGVKSIDPNGKPVEEPAKFDFVAGEKRKDRGEIEFTQTGKRGIGRETVIFTVKPTALTLTCTGDYDFFSGVFPDKGKFHVVLAATELKLQEDGTYRGKGNLKVTGRINLADRYPDVHLRTGLKVDHAEIDYTNPAELIAKPDTKDASVVRVQITLVPIAYETTTVLKNGQRRPSGYSTGVEIWGRIMANRPTPIGRDTIVTGSLTSGARVVTTTSLRVTYADESKP